MITDKNDASQEELKEKNVELSALNKIITLGNESTSLKEFLEKSYNQVLNLVPFDRGGVYLYSPETSHNKLVLHKNVHPDFVSAVEHVDISQGVFSDVFDKHKPFYIEDFSEFMENSKEIGVYSAIIIPLRSKDEYVGSLNIGSPVHQTLPQNEVELLLAIGKQMGIIIQKFESERLLKESERKYRNIVENSLDGISLTNEYGNIIEWNHAMEKITGYSRDEVLGQPVWEVQFPLACEDDRTPEMKEQLKNGVLTLLEKGDLTAPAQMREQRIQDLNGTHKIIQTSSYLIKTERGIMIGTIMRDISKQVAEKKKAEDIILGENKRLLEIDNMRQELMTRISHELKTPLTSIYGVFQMLMDMCKEKLNEPTYSMLDIGLRGSLRLKDLIDNLLDSSLLDIKKIELKLNPENLSVILKNCIDELSFISIERNISLEYEIPERIYIEIDRLRFSQVILNIISNAIKNTPPKGIVSVVLTESQQSVEINVKDTGIGIIGSEKNKLFQKFGKIERYGSGLELDIEGAGLGLYISKEIVELHGGEIIVHSEGRNKGSTFTVRIHKKH